jgi:hypothetical protein
MKVKEARMGHCIVRGKNTFGIDKPDQSFLQKAAGAPKCWQFIPLNVKFQQIDERYLILNCDSINCVDLNLNSSGCCSKRFDAVTPGVGVNIQLNRAKGITNRDVECLYSIEGLDRLEKSAE